MLGTAIVIMRLNRGYCANSVRVFFYVGYCRAQEQRAQEQPGAVSLGHSFNFTSLYYLYDYCVGSLYALKYPH